MTCAKCNARECCCRATCAASLLPAWASLGSGVTKGQALTSGNVLVNKHSTRERECLGLGFFGFIFFLEQTMLFIKSSDGQADASAAETQLPLGREAR